jgi:4a-hydroxytetrahydrobiopterin dehydratase
MSAEEGLKYLEKIPGWVLVVDRIEKEFRFRSYLDGLEFAYALGKTAEEEGHHPDIIIRWQRVKVTLMTHAIKGLSENDFIMAAKTEELYRKFVS